MPLSSTSMQMMFKSGTCLVRIIIFPWLKMRESVPFFSIELMELSTRFMITLRICSLSRGNWGSDSLRSVVSEILAGKFS